MPSCVAEQSPIGVSVLCPSSVDTNVMEAERNRPPSLGAEQRTDVAESIRLMIRGGIHRARWQDTGSRGGDDARRDS